MKAVRRIWRVVLDVFFPPVCVNCGKYAGDETLHNIICRSCFGSININSLWVPALSAVEGPASPTGGPSSPKIIIAAAGSYSDKPLRELVYLLKYGGIEKSAAVLANIIAEYARRTGLMNLLDINNAAIIPIPLHQERKKKRGFNQSELIARELGKIFGIQVENVLKRIKNTSPQIEMKSDKAREENIKGAFALNPPVARTVLPNGDIIIVDDVYTSGATIKEAIKTLKKLKPNKIIILVAARAGH